MTKINKRKVIPFIIVLISWISCSSFGNFGKSILIEISVFCLTLILPYIIRKKAVAAIIMIVITVAVGFYDFSYLSKALPPLLLIYAHKYAIEEVTESKRKKTDGTVSNIYIVFGAMASFFQIVYTLNTAKEFPIPNIDNKVMISILWMPVVAVALVIFAQIKKREISVILRSIYFTALFGVLVAFVCYFPTEGLYLVERARKKLVYWFLFFLMLCFNEDPTVRLITEKLKYFANKGFYELKKKSDAKKAK